MTLPAITHTHQSGRVTEGGADGLWYARAVMTDAKDHDDATIAEACRVLIRSPETDPETWFRARDMLKLVERK